MQQLVTLYIGMSLAPMQDHACMYTVTFMLYHNNRINSTVSQLAMWQLQRLLPYVIQPLNVHIVLIYTCTYSRDYYSIITQQVTQPGQFKKHEPESEEQLV